MTNGTTGEVIVLGRQHGDHAFLVRDFLERNMVPYLWHDIDHSQPANRLALQLGMGSDSTVTVLLPDCRIMHDPSLIELALALDLTRAATTDRYDLVVVGGGPAGLAAAVYGACEGLSVVVVEDDAPGGQAGSTSRIENYLGFPDGLGGAEFARRALIQARRFGVEWLSARVVTQLSIDEDWRVASLDDGTEIRGRAVLVATGMQWRRHPAPGLSQLVNAGVYYGSCLSEAAAVRGRDVHLVGAGNAAGQAALFFAEHAKSVTLLARSDLSSMSNYLVERIRQHAVITVRTNTEVVEAFGESKLTGLALRDRLTDKISTIAASSLHLLIGTRPNTDWLAGLVAFDDQGYVLTGPDVSAAPGATPPSRQRDPLLMESSMPGIFAAGDVRSGSVKRVGSAIGQGAMAVQAIRQYLATSSIHAIPQPA